MDILNAPENAVAGDVIKDSDTAGFMADVIEASREIPVIVDFWAPWCEPCKQLTPALEKAVQGAGGAVRLVKINVDDNQQLAAQLRVQSVPTVFAFKDGQPVDAFQGALPDSQIQEFVARLGGSAGPSPADEMAAAAEQAFQAGDFVNAEALYRQVLATEPGHLASFAGLIQCRIKAGDVPGAQELFDALEPETQEAPDLAGARAALDLAQKAGDVGDLSGLEAQLAANPDDHQARYDLAVAYAGAGRNEEAAAGLLEIIRRDKDWNEQAARQELLGLFEAWGQTHPLTVATRKNLSSLLFS